MTVLPPLRGISFEPKIKIAEREEGALGWVDTWYSLYMHGCLTM
jgi:hypothetical protein